MNADADDLLDSEAFYLRSSACICGFKLVGRFHADAAEVGGGLARRRALSPYICSSERAMRLRASSPSSGKTAVPTLMPRPIPLPRSLEISSIAPTAF